MWPVLTRWLDRCAMRSACRSVRCGPAGSGRLAEAAALLRAPDFFCDFAGAPADLAFSNVTDFHFRSAITTPWDENNQVFGKFFKTGAAWREHPTVVLLHGWNGELGYRFQFPWLARRLRRAGLNTAMLELPYHGRRRPRAPGATDNFISHDLLRMAEATRQALADARALVAWSCAQGSPTVGVWGISLGAWLAALLAGCDPRVQWTVLMSPVVRLDLAIAGLPFCAPIRQSLAGQPWAPERLDPAGHRPRAGPASVLIIECVHDLFAPPHTIEALWEAWERPEIWRLPHGHISVLGSLFVMERTVRWLARRADAQ
jgi:pimeloyl-ACP methyl ester carboxylesterase